MIKHRYFSVSFFLGRTVYILFENRTDHGKGFELEIKYYFFTSSIDILHNTIAQKM